jgi:hypothetical protein
LSAFMSMFFVTMALIFFSFLAQIERINCKSVRIQRHRTEVRAQERTNPKGQPRTNQD